MIQQIASGLFTVADVLNQEECADFIARGEGLGFESATVSAASGPRMLPSVRNNDRAIFDEPALAEWCWGRLSIRQRNLQ